MNPTRRTPFADRTFKDTAGDTLTVGRTNGYVDVRIYEGGKATLARFSRADAHRVAEALVECADSIRPRPASAPEPALATVEPIVLDEATVRLAAIAALIEFVNGGASA